MRLIIRLQIHNFLNPETTLLQHLSFLPINLRRRLRHIDTLRFHSQHNPTTVFQENVSIIRQQLRLLRLRNITINLIHFARNEHRVLLRHPRIRQKRRHIQPISHHIRHQFPQASLGKLHTVHVPFLANDVRNVAWSGSRSSTQIQHMMFRQNRHSLQTLQNCPSQLASESIPNTILHTFKTY